MGRKKIRYESYAVIAMRTCKECGRKDWEIVKKEKDGFDLWQCYKCKRVVCATSEHMEEEGKI